LNELRPRCDVCRRLLNLVAMTSYRIIYTRQPLRRSGKVHDGPRIRLAKLTRTHRWRRRWLAPKLTRDRRSSPGLTKPEATSLMIPATALILATDILAESHVSVAVFFFSSTVQMVVAVFAGAIALCCLFTYFGASLLHTQPAAAFTPALIGALVGLIVRDRFLASCERRRSGEHAYTVRLHLAIAVGLIVFLFPADRFQSGAGSWHVLGFGAGFFFHFFLRQADRRRGRRQRLKHQIDRTLDEPRARPLHSVEFQAIQVFASGRWRRLNRKFVECEAHMTLGLRLVKATVERVRGDNLQAVRTLRDELERPDRGSTADDHLAYLLLAICYRDLGERGAMRRSVSEAEIRRPDCVLCLLFNALTLTEELPLPGERDWEAAADLRERAARCFQEASRRLVNAKPKSALSAVVACSVPLTRRFVNDTYACLLLKNGALAPARALFEASLREDSRSASSYLHLGEWYRTSAAAALAERDVEHAEQSTRASDFCLRMAVALSGDRDNYTRRRALLLLDDGMPPFAPQRPVDSW
jgi:hypothetical protein